jgi:hypothetical protein
VDLGRRLVPALDLWDQLEVEIAFVTRWIADVNRFDRGLVESLEAHLLDLAARLRAFGITPQAGRWN